MFEAKSGSCAYLAVLCCVDEGPDCGAGLGGVPQRQLLLHRGRQLGGELRRHALLHQHSVGGDASLSRISELERPFQQKYTQLNQVASLIN